jgi:hypothetical protein
MVAKTLYAIFVLLNVEQRKQHWSTSGLRNQVLLFGSWIPDDVIAMVVARELESIVQCELTFVISLSFYGYYDN